jgi:hypothetical protein
MAEVRRIAGRLSGDVESIEQAVEGLEKIDETVARLTEENQELWSDINDVLARGQENRRHAEHRLALLTSRIAALEEYLSTDDGVGDSDAIRLVADDACELEHLAAIPRDIRDVKIDRKPLNRAVVVWEHFDEWATYSPHGYIIKSGDLRKHLQTALGESVEWSPLYRVMAAFKENTSPEFEFIDAKRTGKALIKLHEGVSLPESHLVDPSQY